MADQTITAKFEADISDFQSKMQALNTSANAAKAGAADLAQSYSQASVGLDKMSHSANQAASSTSRVSGGARESRTSFLSLAGSAAEVFEEIGEIVGAVAQLIGALGKQRDSVKAMEQAFSSLTRSTAAAKKEMEAIAKMDVSKAYGTQAIGDAILLLRRLGVDAEKATEQVKKVANSLAAAGQSADNLQPILLKLRDIEKQAAVTEEDIDQLAEMGIEAWAILEHQTNKTQEQLKREMKAGAITGREASQMLFGGMEKDAGSAATKAKEFGASWNQLMTELGNSVGPFIDKLAELIRMLAELEKSAHAVSGTLKFIFAPGMLGADIGNFIGTGLRQTIFGHAKGIYDSPSSHWAVVGEEGPELMYVPQGSSIFPHDTNPFGGSSLPALPAFSSAMGSGGQSITVVAQLKLDSRVVAEQVIPHIATMARQQAGRRK